MVTSEQMSRVVPILLSIVLIMGGLCTGLCFAQAATDSAAHSCCHGKNHCGHTEPAMQSHQATAMANNVPVVLAEPLLPGSSRVVSHNSVVEPRLTDFSPPLRASVLRL